MEEEFINFRYNENEDEIIKLKEFHSNFNDWERNEKKRRNQLYQNSIKNVNMKKQKLGHNCEIFKKMNGLTKKEDKKQFYDILNALSKPHEMKMSEIQFNIKSPLPKNILDGMNQKNKIDNLFEETGEKDYDLDDELIEPNTPNKSNTFEKVLVDKNEMDDFISIRKELKLIEWGFCLYKNENNSNNTKNIKDFKDVLLWFHKYEFGIWYFYLEKYNEVKIVNDHYLKNIFIHWIQNWSLSKKDLFQNVERQKTNEKSYISPEKGFLIESLKDEIILWDEFFISIDNKWSNFSIFKQDKFQEKKKNNDIMKNQSKRLKKNQDLNVIKNKTILLLTKQIQKILNSKNLANFYDCQEDLYHEMKIL